MNTPSRYSIVITVLIFLLLVLLVGLNWSLTGYIFTDLGLPSGFMAVGTGLLSAALWLRAANSDDVHANQMAAMATGSSVLFSAVATLDGAIGADEVLRVSTQVGSFVLASLILLSVFWQTVVVGLRQWRSARS